MRAGRTVRPNPAAEAGRIRTSVSNDENGGDGGSVPGVCPSQRISHGCGEGRRRIHLAVAWISASRSTAGGVPDVERRKAYCGSIGARVPFEAEWEYAARAGSSTHHYWGEEIDGRYLWYFNNTDERPEAVGRKRPNAWGLYDVEGNAMEWVQAGGPHSSITRAEGGSVRGGSYASCPEPYPPKDGIRQRAIGLGPAFPGFQNSNFRPDERRYDFGIRCAK